MVNDKSSNHQWEKEEDYFVRNKEESESCHKRQKNVD